MMSPRLLDEFADLTEGCSSVEEDELLLELLEVFDTESSGF